MKSKTSGKKPKAPKPKRYQKVPKGRLTIRQSRIAQILSNRAKLGVKSNGEAAVMAGYSPKNPDQSAAQALSVIRKKAPEILDELGLTVRAVIKNHLEPLLSATDTKIVQHEGEITDYAEFADNTTRLRATEMVFNLHGAFPTEQEKQQGALGIEVVVIDVPRPDRSAIGVKVTAAPCSARKRESESKDDPRPRD